MAEAQATQRTRRFFLGANWKCNGTNDFVREIVQHMINDLDYDQKKLGMYYTLSYLSPPRPLLSIAEL